MQLLKLSGTGDGYGNGYGYGDAPDPDAWFMAVIYRAAIYDKENQS